MSNEIFLQIIKVVFTSRIVLNKIYSEFFIFNCLINLFDFFLFSLFFYIIV